MPDLDLTTGERKGTGTRGPTTGTKTRDTRTTRDSSSKTSEPALSDSALENKLKEMFSDIADWRTKRGDEELAEALEESREDMAAGLVGLTKTIKWLRGPVTVIVNFIKPILAFGKPGRILSARLVNWRMNRQQTQAEPETPYVQQR